MGKDQRQTITIMSIRLRTRLRPDRRGSGAHGGNGRDPAVDQEVCPDDVRKIIRKNSCRASN